VLCRQVFIWGFVTPGGLEEKLTALNGS